MTVRRLGALLAVSVAASPAGAYIVQGTELAPYQAVSNQLAMSHGVVFSSANYSAVTFTELIPGTWGVYGCEPWALPINGGWYNAPIIMQFVDPADGVTPGIINGTVSGVWGDGGGDLDAVDIRQYDIANNLVGTLTVVGATFTPYSFTAVNVHRIEFWANTQLGSGTSDTGWDWIDYPTPVGVPAPGAALVLAGGVAWASRRRR